MATILIIPLWKRGMEGDFKNKCFLMTRDDVLAEMGITVLRFSDKDVFEKIDGVMEGIWSCL
jgi:very-short-patch-repair endonuclease